MRRPDVITTIVTPAASTALIDLPTLRTLLNLSTGVDDSYLKLLIAQISAAAANYCNRVFAVEMVSDSYFPQYDGFRLTIRANTPPLPLRLSRWPVVAITSVTETINGGATALVQDTDYKLDAANGFLRRLDTLGNIIEWQPNLVVAVYSAGYATIPPDIVAAVTSWIKGLYYARNRDPLARSQASVGVYEASYFFGAGPGSGGGMPPDVQGLLDAYSVPLIG